MLNRIRKYPCILESQTYTGDGELDETFAPACDFDISEVRLHLNGDGGANEDFVITVDSANGPAFDVVLLTQGMIDLADVVYQPTRSHEFGNGDGVRFTFANTLLHTYGLEIIWERL